MNSVNQCISHTVPSVDEVVCSQWLNFDVGETLRSEGVAASDACSARIQVVVSQLLNFDVQATLHFASASVE